MSDEDTIDKMLKAAAYLDNEDKIDMTEQELLQKLGDGWQADHEALWCGNPYCTVWRHRESTLDGYFTAEQLRLILAWIDLQK